MGRVVVKNLRNLRRHAAQVGAGAFFALGKLGDEPLGGLAGVRAASIERVNDVVSATGWKAD
jgi:hypothetical protein